MMWYESLITNFCFTYDEKRLLELLKVSKYFVLDCTVIVDSRLSVLLSSVVFRN